MRRAELTGEDLEGSGEEEASALLQSEELDEEEEEGQAAEDDGQDHESLDRLNPLCRGEEGGGRRRKEEESVNNRSSSSSKASFVHNVGFNECVKGEWRTNKCRSEL